MRLVTRCPACSTTFKVVRDQLRISDGWVRCGRCSEVFDATLALWEANDDGTPVVPVPAPPGSGSAGAAPAASLPPSLINAGTSEDDLEEEEPFDLGPDPPPLSMGLSASALSSWPSADLLELGSARRLASDTPAPEWGQPDESPYLSDFPRGKGPLTSEPRFDALPSLDVGAPTFPEMEVQRREPAFSPQLTAASPVVSPIEEAVNAQLKKALRRERVKVLRQERAQKRERERTADGVGDPHLASLPMATPAAAGDRDARSHDSLEAEPTIAAASIEEPVADAAPLPSFIGMDETSPPARRTGGWLWALCSFVALAVLVLQYARHERDLLAAREPALRPALQALCEWTHCRLSPPRSIADISIDGASFSREAEGYRLDFSLRNRARVPLAMPAIELTLLDTQERALLRRVLLPAEYGAPGTLVAGGERSASLPLRLAGPDAAGLPAVAGYRLVAFYP